MGVVRIMAELIAATSLAGIVAFVAWSWNSLPARIPVHFNIHGQPDSWGGKDFLIVLPVLAAFTYGILSLVQRKPQWMNVPFAVDLNDSEVRAQLGEMACVLKACVLILLFITVWAMVQVANGSATGLPAGFLPITLLLPILPTAIYLAKLKRP